MGVGAVLDTDDLDEAFDDALKAVPYGFNNAMIDFWESAYKRLFCPGGSSSELPPIEAAFLEDIVY